jgi:hypothetical protein
VGDDQSGGRETSDHHVLAVEHALVGRGVGIFDPYAEGHQAVAN